MRKLFCYILLVFISVIFFAAQNSSFMLNYYAYRLRKPNMLPIAKKYGDLYALSCLPQFRKALPNFKLKRYFNRDSANINLLCICDSYVNEHSLLYAIPKMYDYKSIHWDSQPFDISLDSKKRNILVIETTERYFLKRFRNPDNAINLIKNTSKFSVIKEIKRQNISSFSFPKLEFFNPKINQNLEFILFDNLFFMQLKEWKASLNYNLFNRIDGNISISTNGQYLLMNETIDESLSTSSFYPLSDSTMNKIITNLNIIYKHFRRIGFQEVYLSVIPNPVCIVDSQRAVCNQLIPRIENAQEMTMQCIKIYDIFKKEKKPVYLSSDSHWNPYGLQLWVDQLISKIFPKKK